MDYSDKKQLLDEFELYKNKIIDVCNSIHNNNYGIADAMLLSLYGIFIKHCENLKYELNQKEEI